jgi:hypothetical protein
MRLTIFSYWIYWREFGKFLLTKLNFDSISIFFYCCMNVHKNSIKLSSNSNSIEFSIYIVKSSKARKSWKSLARNPITIVVWPILNSIFRHRVFSRLYFAISWFYPWHLTHTSVNVGENFLLQDLTQFQLFQFVYLYFFLTPCAFNEKLQCSALLMTSMLWCSYAKVQWYYFLHKHVLLIREWTHTWMLLEIDNKNFKMRFFY